MLIFSELSYIFPDAIHRYIKDKKEIDVFLPDVNIGIEYDGFRWHRENDLKDRNKELMDKINDNTNNIYYICIGIFIIIIFL